MAINSNFSNRNVSFLLKHCVAILPEIRRFDSTPETLLAAYCQKNRLGASERGVLGDLIFWIVRHYRTLSTLYLGDDPHIAGLAAFRLGLTHMSPITGTPLQQDWDEYTLACSHLNVQQQSQLPDWLWQALQAQLLSEKTEDAATEMRALVQSLLEPAPLDLRVNKTHCDRNTVLQQLATDQICAQVTPYSHYGIRIHKKIVLQGHELFQKGWIDIQDEGSQLLTVLLGCKRDDFVIDFCAGAGGKTLAILDGLRGSGHVLACDIVQSRLDILKQRAKKTRFTHFSTLTLDSEHDPRLSRYQGKANRVIVDAPCSGTGTLRRSPAIKWRLEPKQVQDYQRKQQTITLAASRLVQHGGVLLYATCSLLREENQLVVDWLNASLEGFVPIHMAELIQSKTALPQNVVTPEGHFQLWPHRHHTDGFFAAMWRKN